MTSIAAHMKRGRPYRTAELWAWSSNPSRDLRVAVDSGEVVALRGGLYVRPRQSRFGPVPPDDAAVMRSFLGSDEFVFTGPEQWNALGLGTTAMFALPLVYNRKRTGEFTFGNRTFTLSRRAFPRHPTPEWFAVDLLENAASVGVSKDELTTKLSEAVRTNRLDRARLELAARKFGTKATVAAVESALTLAA